MTEQSHEVRGSGPAHRTVEIGVAVSTAGLGVIAIVGSLYAGIGWGLEGPRAGFFPFYIGLFIVLASVINLIQIVLRPAKEALFADWAQLGRVASVVIPTAIYVALVPSAGIYVSSFLLITVFMLWLGRYPWHFVLAIATGVTVLAYLTFEKWFLVPLPKGPLEDILGL